ncbi:Tyrosine protein kinase:Serine/threonine protein kinase:Sel1-like repeat [Lentisphaera araneosa HTCC2155]|jgi:serine/threonine protein kinase|uniref:Tyrosine protein kinase:Serine/threonine protein kinase:Sel1-like repeat n=1 Tax=Lentisphaera araneosa HTCC2155 TaxID=313628 RepID=A6DKN2_9BACT|nr:serine/threonine protein kinase [Lentisphaera araneosa]EDM27930.1 Tyrosine protein kinase:Serine/threonine protein kinase:Sel1-like repeat [Lentisphaera araneosa HTCC2155]
MQDFNEDFMTQAFDQAFNDESDQLLDKISHAEKRYQDGEEIGSGGMKKIVSSFDSFTDRELARAYPLSDETKVDNFISEVRISAKLEHPNIIPLYDIGVEKGQVFFTMKKLSGCNLYDLIKKSEKQ